MHYNDKQKQDDKCTREVTVEALRLVEAAVVAAKENRTVELTQVEDSYRIEIKVRAY